MRVEISREVEEDGEIIRKLRKAINLVGLVKMYNKLELKAREVGECFGRNAMAWWRHENDTKMEWNKRKEDFLYHPVEQYDRELSKPPISCIDF